MYIKILLNYILGYVNILVEGFFTERFINTCINKNIFLFNIKRDKSTIIYANVGIFDFKNVVKIAKQSKCRVKIQRKSGLPFLFNRYKKRKIFAIALVSIICVIIYLSNFIWNIEIVGTDKINQNELIKTINSEGLTIGKLKRKVDLKSIINKIRLDRKDIAWIGIDLKGTNAIVKVVEADAKPEIIKEDEYCNIVSDKEASIIKVNAQNGTVLVKEGDVVKKGTPLIAGWMEGKYTGTRYVHAEGSVEAKVWYSHKERIYYKQEEKLRTGNEEKKYTLNINNFEINLYKKLSNFENYDTIKEQKKLKLFSNLYLPAGLIISNNYEVVNNNIVYNQDEAKEIGIVKSKEELDKNLKSKEDLLNTYINTYPNEEYIDVEVIYEIKEIIGTKEKIVF
ncbi:MAG: sporulation protein YqfD [Clostridia bacterium]|nr:sporulation protein YqfD [Clostridium sp. CAG:571]HJJ06290.1 sporulation protein YqfD [Clostridiaceae bacterium]HJJ14263.1 sporulation protein YqfD [Clostridiaceae bacterium]